MGNNFAKRERQRWRLSAKEARVAGRVAAPVLVPGPEWHPLDDYGPAPEYVPDDWTGPHVGHRLMQGFRTLLDLPSADTHRSSLGYWPDYWPEWADLLARTNSDAATQEMDAEAKNRARVQPSSQDISRMEIVISWSAKYLSVQSMPLARIVQTVALLRSRDYDLEAVARKLRKGSQDVRIANGLGLDLIADGLRRDQTAIF